MSRHTLGMDPIYNALPQKLSLNEGFMTAIVATMILDYVIG